MTLIKKEEHCPDCGVGIGEVHWPECDVARCLHNGLALDSCSELGGCGPDVWSGYWHGARECEEYGFLLVFPDMNRLYQEAVWDRDAQRWVIRAKE
ncbi:hypothetical protein AB0878_49255 [Amycolatopsis sp. NPDC047767]|uniref:hypothetical protein n=1 Tax=Amycolatopsis sp. NPDC047767 TaxID=3156765 RepID=UPI0034544A99